MRQSIVCRAREVALRARLTRYVQHSCDSLRKSRREKRGTRSSAILLSTAVQVPGAFWAVAFLLLPENAGHRAAVERELVACRRRPPAPAAAGDSCGESARGGLACHGLAGGREDQPSNPVSSRGHVGLGEGAAQAAAPAAVPPAGLQAGTGSGLAPGGPVCACTYPSGWRGPSPRCGQCPRGAAWEANQVPIPNLHWCHVPKSTALPISCAVPTAITWLPFF